MPGASTRAAKPDQSALGEIPHGEALSSGLLPRCLLIVPNNRIGAARFQRARGGEPAQAKAEDRNVPAGEDRHGNHRSGIYRNFRVARPASASTTEMIQNLITTVDSGQPFCSK